MMNRRSLTASFSMTTASPASPSIFVMASILISLLCTLRDVELLQVLVQRLQEGRHLHRASPHHVVDLYHVVEFPHLWSVVEMAHVPSDSLVQLLANELIAACRGLSRTGASAYRHYVSCVLSYPLCLLRLRIG